MRLLAAIPHFYRPSGRAADDGRRHGSTGRDPETRVKALTACLASLHQLFGPRQCRIDLPRRTTVTANASTFATKLDAVVCTTGDFHLLGRLPIPLNVYTHKPVECEPSLLGHECHAVLRDRLGDYDDYAYLEHDIILRDPWHFAKLAWFNGHLGDLPLLQPNRFEATIGAVVDKAYIDADIAPEATARFQDLSVMPELKSRVMGHDILFQRPRNPHAGCFFLNAKQLKTLADRPDFLDRSTEFVGPLESAATLGVMKTFRVYKPAPESAAFFEVEHYGTSFLNLIKPGQGA